MTITREQGELMLGFFDRIFEAERLFKLCQSTAFKSFVQSQLAAPRVRQAFEGLRAALETKEEPDT